MEIQIKPEDIDQYVKEAILKSSVGKIISDRLLEQLEGEFSRYYNNPVDEMIKSVLREEIRNILMSPEHLILMQNAIKEKLSNASLSDITEKMMYHILDKVQ